MFIEAILKQDCISDISQDRKSDQISYFSHSLYQYPCTMEQYFRGCNPEKVTLYLQKFDFYNLAKSLDKYSISELVVLAFVLCIAKDTPIIILDEPSNGLGDRHTAVMHDILTELAQTKIVFISTDDERLGLLYNGVIDFEQDIAKYEATPSSNVGVPIVYSNAPTVKPNLFQRLVRSSSNLLLFFVLLICVATSANLMVNYLKHNVYVGVQFKDDRSLGLAYRGNDVSNFVKVYDTNLTTSVSGNELDPTEAIELVTKQLAEKVYIIDEAYLNQLGTKSDKDLKILALPNLIASHPTYKMDFVVTEDSLEVGRLPADNKREMVISLAQLQGNFGYNWELKNAIGTKVNLGDTEYEVVGITKTQIVNISYQDGQRSMGAIEVLPSSKPVLDGVASMLQQNNTNSIGFRKIFIKYSKEKEKVLYDYLVKHAPSYTFSSSYADRILQRASFWRTLPKLLLYSFPLALLIALLFFLITRKSFQMIKNMVEDASNQNFSPRKNHTSMLSVLFLDYIVTSVPILLFVYFMIGSWYSVLVFIPFVVVSLFTFAYCMLMLHWASKK